MLFAAYLFALCSAVSIFCRRKQAGFWRWTIRTREWMGAVVPREPDGSNQGLCMCLAVEYYVTRLDGDIGKKNWQPCTVNEEK
ncbi:hypothetical protein V8C43DRAFT_272140 [Trichoderma afarasin]